MTTVYCSNVSCVHNGQYDCRLETITIGNEFGFGCENYCSIFNAPEYQSEYFIRVTTCDRKQGKGKKLGKKIEYNGFVFYTSDDERINDITVTEERTGYNCGTFNKLKDPKRWKMFCERIYTIDDCVDLPLVEYNEKTRKWEYVEVNNG